MRSLNLLNIQKLSVAILTALVSLSGSSGLAEPARVGTAVVSPNASVPFLGVDGIFTLDTTVPSSLNDPRNPGRIVFNQMERFSFYRDLAGENAIAENCQYAYRGAAPDPFYYPRFQSSIWDLFELVSEDAACSGFKYVALRAPHGDPIHMHVRYGGLNSSFEELLGHSTGEADTNRLDPWWSLYCAEGVTACDL